MTINNPITRAVFVLLVFAALGAVPAAFADAALRPGDQVELRLGGVPNEEVANVSGQYSIDGDGAINLPHVGKIRAAGLSPGQLQTAIEGAYKSAQIYRNPSISITTRATDRFVNVSGEVKMPQRVPYTADMTLLAAISATGGFTEFANQRRVRLIRGTGVEEVDIPRVRRNPANDRKLLPGDQIEVPRSFW